MYNLNIFYNKKMYNLNRIIVIIFNYTRAYVQDYTLVTIIIQNNQIYSQQ